MTAPRIVAFAASLRRGSYNRKLIRVAAEHVRAAGGEVNLLDLNDYPLPIFNGDDEDAHGMPDNARKLVEIFKGANGFMISSPEYNAGMPGLLKNTLDWLSRPLPGDKPFAPFANRPAAIMAASPGRFGGVRMLPLLRQYLSHLQMIVIPQMHGLGNAKEAFDAEGKLVDERADKAIREIAARLVEIAKKLA